MQYMTVSQKYIWGCWNTVMKRFLRPVGPHSPSQNDCELFWIKRDVAISP